jgi:hypothetical protein
MAEHFIGIDILEESADNIFGLGGFAAGSLQPPQ